MRMIIRKLGHIKLTFITTIITIFLAEVFSFFIPNILGLPYLIPDTPAITAVVTLIVTPIISWYFFGLLISLDKLEYKMNILATYDSLTTLLNRQPFLERTASLHNKAFLENSTYCLFLVDMDNFKKINDIYGHEAGDEVLIKYEEIVKKVFTKEDDILGRLGGKSLV